MKATRDDCTCPIDIVDLPIDPWCPVHANPYDLAADYGEVADQRPDDDPAPVYHSTTTPDTPQEPS